MIAAVLNAVYPPKCGLCGLFSEVAICESCRKELRPVAQPFELPPGLLDYCIASFRYEGRAAQAVQRLKYERITSLAEPMSQLLAEVVHRQGIEPDVAVPVPIHWRRRCFRGFNQAEMIACALPNSWFNPQPMVRVRATPPQARLSRDARATNLIDAFAADASVAGKHVLLVDDVTTSGHTGQECAKALKKAGAAKVGLLAFASGGDI